MKILLLRPQSNHYLFSSVPPLGLGYLAGALGKQGHEVEIQDVANRFFHDDTFHINLQQSPPDIIGIQVYSRELAAAKNLLDRIRSQVGPQVTVVAGGAHPSTMPDELFAHLPDIDYGLIGEAEISLPLLARHLAGETAVAPASIPGLIYRDNGAVRINPVDHPADIDQFDFPAWDKMKLAGYRHTNIFGGGFSRRTPAMTMLTSRGCPHRCAFCAATVISGNRLRLRDPERIVDEMEILRNKYGFREIKIIDDNFNAARRHVLAVGEAFARRPVDISSSFVCGLQLQTLDDEILRTLKLLGGYELMVAVESGSSRVLQLMNKQVDLSGLREKVALIHRHGFKVILLFIIGYPGETCAEIKQSIKLSLDLPLDRVHYNCFSPFPGSAVYRELAEQGKLQDFATDHVHFETINYSFVDGLSARQLNRLRQQALLRFYLRPKTIFNLWTSFNSWRGVKFLLGKAADYFGFLRRF